MKIEVDVEIGDKIQKGDIWREKKTGKRTTVGEIVEGCLYYSNVAKNYDLLRTLDARIVKSGEVIQEGDFWESRFDGCVFRAQTCVGEKLQPNNLPYRLLRPVKKDCDEALDLEKELAVFRKLHENQAQVIKNYQLEVADLKEKLKKISALANV